MVLPVVAWEVVWWRQAAGTSPAAAARPAPRRLPETAYTTAPKTMIEKTLMTRSTTIALVDRVISVFSIIVFGAIVYAVSGKRRGAGLAAAAGDVPAA